MEENVLLTEDRGPIRILSLNRPTKLNALNHELVEALTHALQAAHNDDSCTVVILRGNGADNTGTINVINSGKLWLDRS